MNKLIQYSVMAAVGVLVFASLLVPIVSEGMTTAGDPVTYTNPTFAVYKEVEAGDVLKCTSTFVDNTRTNVWTLNDQVVNPVTGSYAWNPGVLSDGLYVGVFGADNNSLANYYVIADSTHTQRYLSASTSTTTNVEYTLTFGNGTVSVIKDTSEEIVTAPYTWAYCICPLADGEYCSAVADGTGYVYANSDVTMCGAYTSGELDTTYYYHNGVNYTGSDFEMETTISKTLVNGTTDVYTASVSVSMTDGDTTETFVPYRVLVPYEVTGHATSGAVYDMLGIIPLLVIVGLIMGIVGVVVTRRLE
jgi:hypothetical protein